MLMETTRFFTELIKAVHHRLLPEGQVRQPLEHLVRQLKSTCDPLALTPLNAEFMLLLLTIFEQINQNPALLNLFIESDQVWN
jgi:hypothetical protein